MSLLQWEFVSTPNLGYTFNYITSTIITSFSLETQWGMILKTKKEIFVLKL
jgi:hypothetical protein